jgi:glycosyltransferase 2 family protein
MRRVEVDGRPRRDFQRMNETNAPVPGVQRKTIARGIRIFTALAVVAAVIVVALTASRETLAGLARIKWYWLLATAGLWLLAAWFDGLRMSILSRTGERTITPLQAIELIFIGYFMAAVTPFQVGGLPLQLYIMNRWGISPGRASSILLGRGIVHYAILFGAAPFVAIGLGAATALLKVLAVYIGIIVAVGVLLVLAGVVFPARIAVWRERLAAHPRPGRFRRLLVRLLGEFRDFTEGLRTFTQGRNRRLVLAAAMLTIGFMAAMYTMSATLLAGLGVNAPVLRTVGLTLLLSSAMMFIPTPGSTGVAEAGAAGLYSMVCPKPMLGVYVVLWRLFGFYIGAIIGGIAVLRLLSARTAGLKASNQN